MRPGDVPVARPRNAAPNPTKDKNQRVKDKRRPASPQATNYVSATKAVARAAAALDCSNRDAVEHINALVRSGRLRRAIG
jgi:hypothetical protein